MAAVEVSSLDSFLGCRLGREKQRSDLGFGLLAVPMTGAGDHQLPAGGAVEVAAGVGLDESLEALDRRGEVLILKCHVGQGPFGGLGEREAVLNLLDGIGLEDRLERLSRLPLRSGSFVQECLPEEGDFVVRILRQRVLQVDRGGSVVVRAERELRVEEVGGGGFLPPATDLGDRLCGVLVVLAREVQQGKLNERGGGLGFLRETRENDSGVVGSLEGAGQEPGAGHRQRHPAGMGFEVVGKRLLGPDRVPGGSVEGCIKLGQLVAVRVLAPGVCERTNGFDLLAGVDQGLDGHPLGRCGGGTGLWVRLDVGELLGTRLAVAEAKIELREAELQRRGHRLPLGQGFLELLAGELPLHIAASGFVRFALEQVEHGRELVGQLASDHGGSELRQDRFGLFGISGLEDRPGGPDLIARFQAVAVASKAVGGLEILAAEPRLAG